MQAIRRRDTGPELALRRRLHAMGLRYRVDCRPVPSLNRRADIVFGPSRVAVMVHGCFFHGCPEHYTAPATNARFWADKVETNRQRDADTRERLTRAGWLVVEIWEHEDLDEAARRLQLIVRSRRHPPQYREGAV